MYYRFSKNAKCLGKLYFKGKVYQGRLAFSGLKWEFIKFPEDALSQEDIWAIEKYINRKITSGHCGGCI